MISEERHSVNRYEIEQSRIFLEVARRQIEENKRYNFRG